MKIGLLLVFVLASVVRLGAGFPHELSRLLKDKEKSISRLAEDAANLFHRRDSYLRQCKCSRHSCSSDTTDFKCTDKLGSAEDFCGTDCPGRNINFESSAFRTPPDMDISQLSTRVKESICLYSNLEPSMKKLVSPKNPSWVYFSSADGVMRIYPSDPREGEVQDEDEGLGNCRTYEPRVRPWFIGASTRPKDIVFVIDRSGSMDDPVEKNSSETRWQVTSRAVVKMLGSLSSFDYVNVVAFDHRAMRLDMRTALRQGTTENLEYMIYQVKSERPGGLTNFELAFREAFDILIHPCNEGTESQSCSGCHKIILFLTDGRDTSGHSATKILSDIEGYQKKLEQAASKRATIFTFSIGGLSDDSIPRQIACAHSGSWAYIGPETDVLTTMNNYFRFLTSSGSRASPIWINPYEDSGGLGNITTVAKPVYSYGTSGQDGIFLGVAGYDVLISEFEVGGINGTDVLEAILERSRTCDSTPQSPCQLQVHRNEYANRAICADNISPVDWKSSNGQRPSGDNVCYKRLGKYYKLFSSTEDWDDAKKQCQSDSGILVVIESEGELAFVAGMSSSVGSWIGARRLYGSDEEFEWIDSAVPNTLLKHSSDSWGIGEPSTSSGTEQCVLIDRRGASGNLNDEDCDTGHSFICEYNSDQSCSDVVKTPNRGYFEIPPLRKCANEEEALKTARSSKGAEDLSSSEVMCPLGSPTNTSERICCKKCTLGDDDSDNVLYIVVLAAVVVLLCCVVVCCCLCYLRRRKKDVDTLIKSQDPPTDADYSYNPKPGYQPVPGVPFFSDDKGHSNPY